MKSDTSDPRERFLSRVNFGDTRFRAFRGFVFLCGGPSTPNLHGGLLSARHLIYHELTSGRYSDLACRLKLAEDIQDWFRDGMYADLVTFEEHLASLSSVILLVVESPGSIAELGAFSVVAPIGRRLITVIDEHHFEAESFIRLGPINQLEATTGRSSLVYNWYTEDPITRKYRPVYEKLRPDIPEVLEDVRKLLHDSYDEQLCRPNDPGHTMIFICELCDLFGALSTQEIEKYVSLLGGHWTTVDVERFLFLLVRCEILKIKAKGHGRYYYPPSWTAHITFALKDGQRVDRDRLRVKVFEYYRANITTRAQVVQLIRASQ